MISGVPWERELERSYSAVWLGHTYTVPGNYRFDGSSIPRLLWPWLGGRFDYGNAQAGALHDCAYDGKLLRDGVPYWMPPYQSHVMWCDIRTQLLTVNAGRILTARYHAQGHVCWAALCSYYALWGRRNYVSFETWRKRNHA